MRLSYLDFEARDLEAWTSFAEEILCAQAARQDDGALLLRLDERPYRILVKHGSADDVAAIGLEVDTREEFERAYARLLGSGTEVRRADAAGCQQRNVAGLLLVADPAGLAVEVSYGALCVPQTPFRPPQPHSGFVFGEQGLGHVLLSVREPERVQKFYEDVLGFGVSDYVTLAHAGGEARLVFMHCNARHHSLALGDLALPRRLVHFMLQCRELDDVGRALDRVRGSAWRQTRALGRHVNDHMISFYVETPSGFQVEYGWGGRDVREEGWTVSTYNVTSIWGHQSP